MIRCPALHDPDNRHTQCFLDPDHNGECGCRSACQLELTVLPPDAEFIAHSRTDVPALVAAVEAVLELVSDEERQAYQTSLPPYSFGRLCAMKEVHAAIRTALGEDE